MKEVMQDNHRERIIAQMERDQQRLMKEQQTVEQAQKAKKYISAELRAKMEKRELENKKKEQNRIEAMRQRRERREAETAKKQAEEEKIAEMRKVSVKGQIPSLFFRDERGTDPINVCLKFIKYPWVYKVNECKLCTKHIEQYRWLH